MWLEGGLCEVLVWRINIIQNPVNCLHWASLLVSPVGPAARLVTALVCVAGALPVQLLLLLLALCCQLLAVVAMVSLLLEVVPCCVG